MRNFANLLLVLLVLSGVAFMGVACSVGDADAAVAENATLQADDAAVDVLVLTAGLQLDATMPYVSAPFARNATGRHQSALAVARSWPQ